MTHTVSCINVVSIFPYRNFLIFYVIRHVTIQYFFSHHVQKHNYQSSKFERCNVEL